jgi:hypothetical protein
LSTRISSTAAIPTAPLRRAYRRELSNPNFPHRICRMLLTLCEPHNLLEGTYPAIRLQVFP